MNLENYTKNKYVSINKIILLYWKVHNSSSKLVIYTSTKQCPKNRKCLEQQLNTSPTDFHIQREHNFISPKNSFRQELRNSKESVNFNQRINSSLFIALMNLQQKTSFSLSQKIKISWEITQWYRNQLAVVKELLTIIQKNKQVSQIRKLYLRRHRTWQL